MPRNFRIRRLDRFDRSLDAILEAPYFPPGKKGRKLKEKFLDYVGSIVQQLETDPFIYREEPPPAAVVVPGGWSFRKARRNFFRFRFPERKIRLMYLVNQVDDEVTLMLLYTHAEFPERPPDGDLNDALDEVFGKPKNYQR